MRAVRRSGVSPTTVQKWRARQTVADLATGPRPPSTGLMPEGEAIVIAFRRHARLPLDHCQDGRQPTILHSYTHRCLKQHGNRPFAGDGCRLSGEVALCGIHLRSHARRHRRGQSRALSGRRERKLGAFRCTSQGPDKEIVADRRSCASASPGTTRRGFASPARSAPPPAAARRTNSRIVAASSSSAQSRPGPQTTAPG